MAYPVSVSVERAIANRNRLTTAFRLILAIPHLILVGGVGIGIASHHDSGTTIGGEGGLLGAVAFFLAIVSWFTILIGGTHILGIRQFTAFYLRWRVRALAYFVLLVDPYPPFGDAPYPAVLEIVDPTGSRDRLTVALRRVVRHFVYRLVSGGLTQLQRRGTPVDAEGRDVRAVDGGRVPTVFAGIESQLVTQHSGRNVPKSQQYSSLRVLRVPR
jgi:hypothetical protein